MTTRLDTMGLYDAQNTTTEEPTATDPVSGYDSVRVRPDLADNLTFFTVSLGADVSVLLLPQDPWRYRATVIAVDNAVVLTHSQGLASNPANQVSDTPAPSGMYIPAGVPVVITSKGACWVAATTTASSSRVSVAIEKYEDS